jgi:limonene-1,2-epoxide hydrolase
MSPDASAHRRLIEGFWGDLYRRDFEKVGSYFAEDGLYEDVPTPDRGARGPAQVAARLRLGLEPLADYQHRIRHIVADGDLVVTEHAEEWRWHTGESVVLPFVSVHEIRSGKIARWTDYWDLNTLLGAAPGWWLERIAKGAEGQDWARPSDG